MNLSKSYLRGPDTGTLLRQTIGQYFDQIANQYPEHLALISRHQGIRWTYSEFQHQIDKMADGLIAIDIGKGDRIGIWAPNCYEWCLTQFASAKIGAIMVCINPAYRLIELEYALNKVECKAIVCADRFKSSDYLQMLQALAPELNECTPGLLSSEKLPHLTTVIRMGETRTAGMYNFAEVVDSGGRQEFQHLAELKETLSADDAINIQFTSGTTGKPKGATLSHVNILNNAKYVGDALRLTDNDKLCIAVPLYHCFGMVLGSLVCITHGSTIVLPGGGFDPLTTLQAVSEEGCTALHGVPTMFISELEHPRFAEFDLSTLRTGIMGGSPCPVEIIKRVIQDMHMSQVLIAYGQTETGPINHITDVDDHIDKRVGTVGKAVPKVEIKLVDESGEIVATGEEGEICCRGYSVMRGYWNDDEKTTETIDQNGWLHAGDIGIMDDEGYVQIVGRLSDMIIRGGENIYPREIEEFLYTHPKIQEVQVIGVKDAYFGEQVCACIQVRQGESITEEEVKKFCKDKISHFKVPHYMKFVDEYPMTVTGKIQKHKFVITGNNGARVNIRTE